MARIRQVTRALTVLTGLLTACAGQATEHLFVIYAPLATYTVEGSPVTSSETGILRYNHVCLSGPCSVHLERVTGVLAQGCALRSRTQTSCLDWNEAVAFYHTSGDSADGAVVGYIEFRGGAYWTAGGASFGWKTEEVTSVKVCGDDWAAMRVELGIPPDIAMWQIGGE